MRRLPWPPYCPHPPSRYRAGPARRSVRRCGPNLRTTDHKQIGKLYLVTTFGLLSLGHDPLKPA